MKISIGTNVVDSNSIAVVGEYTTGGGPFFDDHFIVIISCSGEMVEGSTGTSQGALTKLNESGLEVSLRLSNITNCASRIILPKTLLNRPLFDFKSTSWGFRKLINVIRRFGITETTAHLTDEVLDYLRNNPKPVCKKSGAPEVALKAGQERGQVDVC